MPTRATRLRLDLSLGAWSSAPAEDHLVVAREAQRLGFGTVWVAEAYGTDAATPLAWLAARCPGLGIGSAVLQVPARSPAMTAMTAATLDLLSGGRFSLGLGVSGRHVSEGWHGVAFADPVGRAREYVGAVRAALRREPLRVEGEHVRVPPPGSTARSIALAVRPARADLPLLLAAVGPRLLALTGEVADGWLSSFADPGLVAEAAAVLAAHRPPGAAAAEAVVTCPLVAVDDAAWPAGAGTSRQPVDTTVEAAVDAAAGPVRAHAALYLGGMGGREDNVYAGIARRLGHGEAVARVAELYLSRRRDEAAAAVPAAFVDQVGLLGPRARLAERLAAYAAAGATSVALMPFAADPAERARMLRTAAEARDAAGLRA